MKNDSDIYSRIICIGNHKVLSFNLELICTSEFFKNLKLHKPVRRVQLHFNTVRVYVVITTDQCFGHPVIFGSPMRFKASKYMKYRIAELREKDMQCNMKDDCSVNAT